MPGAAAKRDPDLDALAEDLEDRGRAATAAGITAFERRIGAPLPPAYRAFLERVNGGSVTAEWEFRGKCMLQVLYGIRRDREYSLMRRFDEAREYPIPDETIPIASDIGANLICLAVRGPRAGSVWYWDHEEGGERLSDLTKLAPSFSAFLRGLRRTGPEKKEALERILDRDDAAGMERYLKDLPRKQWSRNLPSGRTLLEEAAARGAMRVMKVLIGKKVAGRHALGAAISHSQPEALKMLLHSGFKPDAYSLQGCAYRDDAKCLRILVEHVPRFPEASLKRAEHTANFETMRNSQEVRALLARARKKSER